MSKIPEKVFTHNDDSRKMLSGLELFRQMSLHFANEKGDKAKFLQTGRVLSQAHPNFYKAAQYLNKAGMFDAPTCGILGNKDEKTCQYIVELLEYLGRNKQIKRESEFYLRLSQEKKRIITPPNVSSCYFAACHYTRWSVGEALAILAEHKIETLKNIFHVFSKESFVTGLVKLRDMKLKEEGLEKQYVCLVCQFPEHAKKIADALVRMYCSSDAEGDDGFEVIIDRETQYKFIAAVCKHPELAECVIAVFDILIDEDRRKIPTNTLEQIIVAHSRNPEGNISSIINLFLKGEAAKQDQGAAAAATAPVRKL